jgi:hypothetical protein
LTGRLHCKKGCGDRFGVVLPVDAPSPRAFVARYGRPTPPPPTPKAEREVSALEEHIPGCLVEIGEGGTFLKVHARAFYPEILHLGFDWMLAHLSQDGRKPPRLAVTRGAQWSRDSARDWKVISDDDDPDDHVIPFSVHGPDLVGDGSRGPAVNAPKTQGDV